MTASQSLSGLCRRPRLAAALLAGAIAFTLPAQATDLQSFGGKGGDASYRLECPPGALLAGFIGHAGAHVSHLSIECKRRESQNGNRGDVVGPLLNPGGAPAAGRASGGALRRKTCSSSHVVYTVNFLFARSGPSVLDWPRAGCMDPADSQALATAFDFPGADSPQLGDSPLRYPASGWQSCPQGELPAGIYGTSQFYVDSIGLICRPVSGNPSVPEQGSPDVYRSPFGITHPAAVRPAAGR